MKGNQEFKVIFPWTGEYYTQISRKEMVSILYQSILRAGAFLILFGIINLFLLIFNLVIFNYYSWGNIIFSSYLLWLLYGKYQIGQEIQKSIYNDRSVKHIVTTDSIDLKTDNLHYTINTKHLSFQYKNSTWIVFKRTKFDDYIILENKENYCCQQRV